MKTLSTSLTLVTLAALCASTGLRAQFVVREIPAPVGVVDEIDFDRLPLGPTDVASINSVAAPSASDLADIVLVPRPTVPPGSYTRNPGLGRALALVNGGLELIDPPVGGQRAGRYDAFDARFLLGGLSTEFGIGIGDYVGTVELEFLLGGASLGRITSSAYTTPALKYFEAHGDVFDEVRVYGAGNWVLAGLAIGDTYGPPLPALLSEGFVDGEPNDGPRPGECEDGSTVSWQIRDRRDLLVGAAGVFFANVGLGEPQVGDSTPFLSSRFVQTTGISSPAGPTLGFPAVMVGASTGPAPRQSVQIPPGVFVEGTVIRLQPLVLDPGVGGGRRFPLRTTDPIRFAYRGPAIIVSAEGSDTFDSTDGFWRVRHNDPSRAPITRVVFDGRPNGMAFDTDQTGMAGLFEGGNSRASGCTGSYRDGSDVTTGLVYDARNTVTATPCDPNANTGWIGTNETTTDTFQTLEFRFNSFAAGTTFAFDVDTDGPLGNHGGAMGWMTITVELADGTVHAGILEAASFGANRAEFRF